MRIEKSRRTLLKGEGMMKKERRRLEKGKLRGRKKINPEGTGRRRGNRGDEEVADLGAGKGRESVSRRKSDKNFRGNLVRGRGGCRGMTWT